MHLWYSSFGIASAFLIVGGFLLLQWQRDRHRYQLLRAAMERGDPTWNTHRVDWLGSLRRSVGTLVLGVGLIVMGTFLWIARPLAAPPAERVDEARSIEVEGRDSSGVAELVAHMLGVSPPKRPPRRASLEQENWERLQKQQAIGLSFAGAGVLLTLIGCVNCTFVCIERRIARNHQAADEGDPGDASLGSL